MEINTILSIIAILIAAGSFGFTFYKYKKHDKELNAQQKQLNIFNLKAVKQRDEESKKAVLIVNSIKEKKGKRKVRISNTGKALAQNIRVDFFGDANIKITKAEQGFKLNPEEFIDIDIQLYMEAPDKIKMTLNWEDAFSQGNMRGKEINL